MQLKFPGGSHDKIIPVSRSHTEQVDFDKIPTILGRENDAGNVACLALTALKTRLPF